MTTTITMALIFLFVLLAGGLRSVEAGCQNSLKNSMKNIWLCAVISYTVALTGFLIFLGLSTILSTDPSWPTLHDFQHMPWWAPFGGLVGGVAVVGMITVARYVGVATFSALVIVSEMVVALIMDNFGLMGFATRHATPQRLIACALITLAVYLMAKDSPDDTASATALHGGESTTSDARGLDAPS